MDDLIVDDMKKESKLFGLLTILGYILSFSTPLLYIIDKDNNTIRDITLSVIVYFSIATIALYGWLYAKRYRIEISTKSVKIRTLFKKKEIAFCDCLNYTCKRYNKSIFYQFTLYTTEKKIVISTRYNDAFETILNQNQINLK